ncbi:MAG: hypothetical protein Kow0029_04560 [Candidatus Rifleibacteriota bacterium]
MITNAAFFFASAPEKLLGYSKNFQLKNADAFYEMVDPHFSERNFTDNNTGAEELAAQKPDLILARDIERSRLEKNLAGLNIPILFFNLENPESYMKDIACLGQIFAEKEKARKINSFYQGWRNKLREMLKNKKEEDKPRVLHLFYSERNGPAAISVSPAGWIQAILVEEAGGKPVWISENNNGNNWKKVGFDQIAAWNPDYIFVTSYFEKVDNARMKLAKNQLWKMLTAVRNNQIYSVPEDFFCWDQPDARWILGLYWMAAMLNPDKPQLKTDLRKIFHDFYQLYGIDSKHIKLIGDLPPDLTNPKPE